MTRASIKACILAAFATVLLPLAGCGAKNSDLKAWVDEQKLKKGEIEPLPPTKTFDKFTYTLKSPEDRDPFDLPHSEEEEAQAQSGPRPDQNRVKEPLEAFPLDGLTMVGTLGAAGAPEGLLKDPDGVIRRVHVGNYIGQNYGRITAINMGQIELVELVPNQTGGWDERKASISLANASRK